MEVIYTRNVNSAYVASMERVKRVGLSDDSRNGSVLVAPTPVMTVTQRPQERVLFDPGRNANPFFHFFECLWMLHGSDDGTWLDRFVKDFSSRFGEPEDGRIWGAYGNRWRNHWNDQVRDVVDRLIADRTDRRLVISMWDPVEDTMSEKWTESGEPARDLPCNTHIYPRITGVDKPGVGPCMVLDLTVCCRSNDIIWGATGANAVHFSFLQEFMARCIGVEVGTLYQLSNNWHAYDDVMQKMGEPENALLYEKGEVSTYPIKSCGMSEWLEDLDRFMDRPTGDIEYTDPFFTHVARPMWVTHAAYRSGDHELALQLCGSIMASDWARAAREWIERRAKK